jgi:DNA polymerase-4
LLAERLGELCLGLEAALRLHLLAARRVSIKVRYDDHETTTRSRTLAHPVAAAAQVEGVARELLGRTQAGSRPVRLLGVAVTGLVPRGREDRQLELFPPRAG